MNMREAIIAALRRDPDLIPKMTGTLRDKIDHENGRVGRVVQVAGAVAPILEEAVRKRPSRLGKLGLKSAHLLAGLASDDEGSNRKLAAIANGSTVGIVFIDVADFTRFTAENGDDVAVERLSTLENLIARAIRSCRGEIVKRLGDGFLLAFPSASQAIRGALAVKSAVDRKTERGFDLRLRIAVHAGEPLVEQDDLLGHDVNLTARLLDHMKPGKVLVSEPAKELAGNRLKTVHLHKAKSFKIRGLAGRVTAFPADVVPRDPRSLP
jgi:class 3 adenylate cyclase